MFGRAGLIYFSSTNFIISLIKNVDLDVNLILLPRLLEASRKIIDNEIHVCDAKTDKFRFYQRNAKRFEEADRI